MQLRTTRRRPGQEMVEIGLFTILLLMLVMGAADFGRMLFGYVTITQAAKDGARKGAAYPNCRSTISNFASVTTGNVSTTYNSIDYAVAQSAQNLGLGYSGVTIAFYSYDVTTGVRTSTGTAATGGQVDVTASYAFTTITPLVGPIIGSVNVAATATHIIEAAPTSC